MKPKKTESGGQRLARQKRSLIWVSPEPADKQKIRIAAAILGVPMGQFLLAQGLAAAEKIIEKNRNNHLT